MCDYAIRCGRTKEQLREIDSWDKYLPYCWKCLEHEHSGMCGCSEYYTDPEWNKNVKGYYLGTMTSDDFEEMDRSIVADNPMPTDDATWESF